MNKMNKKILIIEDEAPLLEALVEKFTQAKFTVLKARDGRQGLKVALGKHPDVILLDIVMPKMDGLTVLRKLRADAWGKDAPVIFLTNLRDAAKQSEAAKSGANEYLVKSAWSLKEVVNKVKEKLDVH